MRINCPTCEVEFDVSDKQVGQKGLCPDCGTRFVIPLDSEGGSEILSLGKATGNKANSDRDTDDEDDGESRVEEDDAEPQTKELAEEPAEEPAEEAADIACGASPLALLAVGLAIGLVIGFVVGWLVWRRPEPGRAPFGDKSKSGSGSPFLQSDVN
ncbi:MAG: hypothetical protein VCA55_04965 [Verrucomicrobiales bacterium]